MIGPALGIASTKSLRVVDVWFSTAFKKLIDSESSSVFCLNAVCIAKVAFIASCLSTSPSTARRVVSFIAPNKSFPCFPVAAISAANARVSLNAAPYDLAKSSAVLETSALTFPSSCEEVAATPP